MIPARIVNRLQAVLGAIAPINGVSVPTIGTSVGVRIDFDVSATQPQQDAATAALASFDWSNAAQTAYEAGQNQNFTALANAAVNAVANNLTFLGIATPTNAQAVAQVQALTTQVNQIIRYLARL